jgi:hypothetical protein
LTERNYTYFKIQTAIACREKMDIVWNTMWKDLIAISPFFRVVDKVFPSIKLGLKERDKNPAKNKAIK